MANILTDTFSSVWNAGKGAVSKLWGTTNDVIGGVMDSDLGKKVVGYGEEWLDNKMSDELAPKQEEPAPAKQMSPALVVGGVALAAVLTVALVVLVVKD